MSTLLKQKRKERRVIRIRAKVRGTAERPRLAVTRTLKHVYAQIIDDGAKRTLCAASDADVSATERKGKKKAEIASAVGKLLAERATKKGVKQVVFDRRDKRYHGRVKALADGARAGGLNF